MSSFMTRRLGATLYLARDYDGALEQLRRASEIDPHLAGAVDNWMAFAYIEKGMPNQAVDHDLAAMGSDWPKLDIPALRSIYEQKGWDAYWSARIVALHPYADQGCVWYSAGVSYTLIHDSDRAFASFNRAVDQRCFEVVWLQTDPVLDPIRHDARYTGLLQRLNLLSR